MLAGYMRVSSDSDLQRDALLTAGVAPRHLFEDRASGAKDDRSGLTQALEFVHAGDVLVVWKLDRLGRSLSHLLAIVNTLRSDGKIIDLGRDRSRAGAGLTEFSGVPAYNPYKELVRYVPAKEKKAWHERAMRAAEGADLSSQIELWLEHKETERLVARLHNATDEELEDQSHYWTEPLACTGR